MEQSLVDLYCKENPKNWNSSLEDANLSDYLYCSIYIYILYNYYRSCYTKNKKMPEMCIKEVLMGIAR